MKMRPAHESDPLRDTQAPAAEASTGGPAAEPLQDSPRLQAQRTRLTQLKPRAAPAGGLPARLRSGIESLSGVDMSGVRVHRNSSKPAQLQALAYAQGRDIHLGPGQERHLPHEAWHVVQQAQGRVRPDMQMKSGLAVNADPLLEREADIMGAKALMLGDAGDAEAQALKPTAASHGAVAQRLVGFEFETKWDVRRPQGVGWNSDTALVRGMRWQISPDEIQGRNAKIEFKTAPFDVDGDAQAAILTIVDTFESIEAYIQAQLLPLPAGYSPLPSLLGPGVEVQPDGPLTAKPQVTGGVRTDLVLSFLKDLSRDDGATDLMPGQQKKEMLGDVLDAVETQVDEGSGKAMREYWGVVALLANLVRRFQKDRDDARQEYAAWRTQTQDDLQQRFDAWANRVNPDEQQRAAKMEQVREHFAELAQEKQEEIRARLAPSYAKARASALPRIAFNDLPQVRIGNLERDVLRAAGLTAADGARRMFPLGMKRDGNMQETISQWLAAIQRVRAPHEEGELWSARSLGTGPVGPQGQRDTGIPFELRGLPGPLPHDQWLEFATPFLNYFRALNRRRR